MNSVLSIIRTTVINSPLFGITLSIVTYQIGIMIHRRWKSPFTSPLIVSIILCCLTLWATNIPYEAYNTGGAIISMFLGPATAVLAVSMYQQLDTLKRNILPVLAGTVAGSAVSITSILCMCRLFRLDKAVTVSLLPKSVTTPIALSLSQADGGLSAITVAAVVLTGNLGAILAPTLIKLFRIKNPVTAGLAIGTSSHAVGTAKALELGQVEGAASSLAIGCAGIATVILSAFLH